MNLFRTTLASALTAAAFGLFGGAAHAANARDPYGNVDHRVDAGNDTGDSQVDQLNAQQLDQNYRGPYYIGRPPPPGVRPPPNPPPGVYQRPPPGYYPPPPAYYAPPGYPPPRAYPPPGY